MDLMFCGIIDVVLVLLLLLTCFIGYKKGFLLKAIGLVSFLVALIVAFIFCSQLAGLFEKHEVIYPSIYSSVFQNVSSSEALNNPNATVSEILQGISVPGFIANMIGNAVGSEISSGEIAVSISTYITGIAMNVICFLILFIGVFVLAFILKIVAKVLRGNAIIRFVDGVLGIVLYGCIFVASIYIIFTIVRYCMPADWFSGIRNFLEVDMQLSNPDTFRLSKYIYEHNVLYEIINMIF